MYIYLQSSLHLMNHLLQFHLLQSYLPLHNHQYPQQLPVERKEFDWLVGLWSFMPIQQYFSYIVGGQFYWWTKTRDLSQVPDKLDHIMKRI